MVPSLRVEISSPVRIQQAIARASPLMMTRTMNERMAPCCHTPGGDGRDHIPRQQRLSLRQQSAPATAAATRSRLVGMTSSENPAGGIRPRPVVDLLPRYAAGKPPVPVEGLTSYKLSSNENPLPPIPAVQQAIAAQTDFNRYPDPLSSRLREALARVPGCARRGHRHRRRQPGRPEPAADHLRRPERRRQGRRGHLRLALVRGLPDLRRTGRRRERPDPADRRRAA